MVEEERVISKSSVWPEERVGKVTCCLRAKVSRSVRKCKTEGDVGKSTCMLKSPVIRISEGEVASSSSRVENSEIKVDIKEEGGR